LRNHPGSRPTRRSLEPIATVISHRPRRSELLKVCSWSIKRRGMPRRSLSASSRLRSRRRPRHRLRAGKRRLGRRQRLGVSCRRGRNASAATASPAHLQGGREARFPTGDFVSLIPQAPRIVQQALDQFGGSRSWSTMPGSCATRSSTRMTSDQCDVVAVHRNGSFSTSVERGDLFPPSAHELRRLHTMTSTGASSANFGPANYMAAKLGIVVLPRARYGPTPPPATQFMCARTVSRPSHGPDGSSILP